jgi:hypothetical protein
MAPPIILKRPKKSGGSKSRKLRMKDADRAERAFFLAAERTVYATGKGLRRYDRSRRASARRERDGAIIDLLPNMSRAMVVGTRHLAPLPMDLVRAVPIRRMTRRSMRAVTWMLETS